MPPVWWMRLLLILTCTGVSFAHGTNDGQKSIGLIMLTIIGLMPTTYALNLDKGTNRAGKRMQEAAELIERADGDRKERGLSAARALVGRFAPLSKVSDIPAGERPAVRNDLNQTLASLRKMKHSKTVPEPDKKSAKSLHDGLMRSVQYAPWWVRVLSALCLGVGTMVGYRRIVKTLGGRLGKQHVVPAQGASAELVAAGLISFAGFIGHPVSTTHVVTGGIAGTLVGSGAGIQKATLWLIAAAWTLTLPATIAFSGGFFYLLS